MEFLVLNRNTWNHLTEETKVILVCYQTSSHSFKNEIISKLISDISYIYIYIYINVGNQMTDVKLLLLHNNTRNHWTVCKQMSSGSESVLENETHKVLWDFKMQTDHPIPARRPDLVIVNKYKENRPNSGLCLPGRPQGKIKRKRKQW